MKDVEARQSEATSRKEQIAMMATLAAAKHNLVLRNASHVSQERIRANEAWGNRSRSAALTFARPGSSCARCSLYRDVHLQLDLDPEQQPCDRVESLGVLSVPLCSTLSLPALRIPAFNPA